MQTLIDRLRQTSGPALSAMLFALAFGLGLAVFSFSGSIAVSAICMGLVSVASALAARELVARPAEGEIKSIVRDETRAYGRRLTEIGDRLIDMETEIRNVMNTRTLPQQIHVDGLKNDITQMSSILGELIAVIDTHDAQITKLKTIGPRAVAAKPVADDTKPIVKAPNPLVALQTENMVREDILNGKLRVHLHDMLQSETGRVLARQVTCTLEGRLPEFRSDHDLVKARVSPGVIQLFDRMRFGFAYEFASQFGAQTGSAPILCPLMNATFGHADVANEIIEMIERHDEIAAHLIIAMDHALISRPTPHEHDRLHRLQHTGVSLAAILSQDMMVDPDILLERNVRYALVDAAMLLGRAGQTLRSAIHPSDLASYLARHDIILLAQNVENAHDLRQLKAMGVMYGSGHAFAANGTSPAATRQTRPQFTPDVRAEGTSGHIVTPQIAPLRERLRRVRT